MSKGGRKLSSAERCPASGLVVHSSLLRVPCSWTFQVGCRVYCPHCHRDVSVSSNNRIHSHLPAVAKEEP